MADTLEIFGVEYTNVTGIIATTPNETDLTYIRPQGTKNITANGSGIDVAEYASVDVNVPSGQPNLQTKTKTYTPTESAQTETVSADSGYDGLSQVSVSVGAISSTYVGSGITRRSSSDLTASGATVTVPSGYYSAQESKAVASGTQGTPSFNRSEGTNSVTLTPVVVNSAGYINGGTRNGEAVTISASELVSGTLTISSSGTKDVTNYASASVAAGTEGAPTATKGTVSNHSISVTPKVTNSAGYITGSTKTGTAVTVTASELVSGTYTVDSSGTKDVTNYASASVPTGTAGTPSASKGAVSNHSVSVTPSVTNATGWITGSTKTGTAVTVSASELVSGTLSLTDNGTEDCTNYASVNVNIPFVTYYTGSSTPASSLGSNGDIYLKVVS